MQFRFLVFGNSAPIMFELFTEVRNIARAIAFL